MLSNTNPLRTAYPRKKGFTPFCRAALLGTLFLTAAGSSHASLIAYEGFDHSAGTPLAGKTGQQGFASAYTTANAGLSLSAGGSRYGDLPVAGNKLAFAGSSDNGNFGVLSSSPSAPGTTVYLSYLMKTDPGSGYAGVSLFQGNDEVLFTGRRSGSANLFGLEPKVGAGQNTTSYSTRLSLVVCRIDFQATSATIRMYVNPQSGQEPATANATVTRTSALTYDRIRFQSSGLNGVVDEVRLGDTFADVAPITYGSVPAEVVVLGSSVAAASGAATQSEGWAYRLKSRLETPPPVVPDSRIAWNVHNASIGGNNTSNVLGRFQNDVATPRAGANIVIISLSLANEGLVGSSNPQPVFDSFKNGVAEIVTRCRAEGFYPVISLCYPQNTYNAQQYAFIRRMNLLLNTWDVPSINFLGAIDDGSGHWAAGYSADDGHPNSQGHDELYASVVPSLFDAIVSGKTTTPKWDGTPGYLRIQQTAGVNSPLSYVPAQTYRSFTLSFRVRATSSGTIAAIGSGSSGATVEIRSGSLVYTGATGAEQSMPVAINDGRWHDIAISHRKTTNQTLVFVDGRLETTVSGALSPADFTVGGPAAIVGRAQAPSQADYQDVAVYRGAWTADEAFAQSGGALQQASLEVLATLDDAAPSQGSPLASRAQSFSTLGLQTDGFATGAGAVPAGLSGASFASGAVTLNWTAAANPTATFIVERRRAGEAWSVIGTRPGNSPHYEDTGLIAATSYDYRLSFAEGSLQGDAGQPVSVVASGQDSISYQSWIAGFYPPVQSSDPVYLIDFNTSASPNYGGVTWNTVNSRTSATPYALRDSSNNTSPFSVAISDSFDQDRNDNGAPLTEYAAAAQTSQFALRDDSPLSGAITFSGLDPASTYDFSFFARRGTIVAGFNYNGVYTFTGGGTPVTVTVNANMNTVLTQVPKIAPTAGGVITLTITSPATTGDRFAVINFIKFRKSVPGTYLVDFNTNPSPAYGLVKWNTVTSTAPGSPLALSDTYNNASPFTVAITDGFDQFRTDNIAPLADFAAAAQNSQFALRDDNPLTGGITFSGLNPAKTYDFSFFARRGSLVAGYDYTGRYTFSGAGAPMVVTMDGKDSTTLTQVPPVTPGPAGTVTLTVTSNVESGQRFPVINFIRFREIGGSSAYNALIDPAADPDGDGISNFEEYARGFNPTVADGAPFQVERFSKNGAFGMNLEITRDRHAREADYILETSDELQVWTTDSGAVRSVASSSGTKETLLFESSLTGEKRFYRFRLVKVVP